MAAGAPHFDVRVWGARGSFPSSGPHTARYGGHTACIEVRSMDGDTIVLDAGTGIRGLGALLSQEMDGATTHLFLTHRHADHVIGLPHFWPLYERGRRISLRCGNSDATGARETTSILLSPPLFPALEGIANSLDIVDFEADDSAVISARVRVRKLPARHPGGAAIFVVDSDRGHAIAYAPDNELAYASNDLDIASWRSGIARSLEGIPVLVHDAMFRAEELSTHVGWGHSSAEEATRFALECGAGTLVLFHHHPDRSDDAVDAMIDACRELVDTNGGSLKIVAAFEGMELRV